MHPIERLRFLVGATGLEPHYLVPEVAEGLAAFGGDRASLVLAARRLVQHRPSSGPLWWLCSRVLLAPDPATAAWSAVDEFEADPTDRLAAEALASRRSSAVHDQAVSTEPRILEALIGGGSGFLVMSWGNGFDPAGDERDPAAPLWITAGVGRFTAPPVWQKVTELRASNTGPSGDPRLRGHVFIASDRVDAVIGPGGIGSVEHATGLVAPAVAPELLRAV